MAIGVKTPVPFLRRQKIKPNRVVNLKKRKENGVYYLYVRTTMRCTMPRAPACRNQIFARGTKCTDNSNKYHVLFWFRVGQGCVDLFGCMGVYAMKAADHNGLGKKSMHFLSSLSIVLGPAGLHKTYASSPVKTYNSALSLLCDQ